MVEGRRRHIGPKGITISAGVAVVAAAILVVMASAAWQALQGARVHLLAARETLQHAVDEPGSLRTPEGRRADLAEIDSAAAQVALTRRSLRDSRALSTTRAIPGLATQRRGVLRLVDDAAAAADAAHRLLTSVDTVAGRCRLEGGRVPLSALDELGTATRSAATSIDTLKRSPAGLWGPLADARRQFDDVAGTNGQRLRQASDGLDAARTFLGVGGPRRYLLALQNNTEMRDQGMVLGYATLTFDGGRMEVEHQAGIIDATEIAGRPLPDGLRLSTPISLPLPDGTRQVFGDIHPQQLWQSVNAGADFRWSGRAMSAMYTQATGQPVDGVIALDVPGLADLLQVTGPVRVAGVPEPITADNSARILLHDLYEVPQNRQPARHELLSTTAAAISHQLTSGRYDVVALSRELGDAAAGGHLRLWSADDQEEATFERSGVGGDPAFARADATFHAAVENRTATKLDYYVKVRMHQDVHLTDLGTAIVRTTVTVDNQAPPRAAASYMLGPDGFASFRPGEYSAWILLWSPQGSTAPGSVEESGLQLDQRILDGIEAGDQRSAVFDTIIPHAVRDGQLVLRYVPQPRLAPPDLDITVEAPGWRSLNGWRWSGPWDRTLTLGWSVRRQP